jgi:hypothetical protein
MSEPTSPICHLVMYVIARMRIEKVIGRCREQGVDLYFRADAAFAKREIYEMLEAEGIR